MASSSQSHQSDTSGVDDSETSEPETSDTSEPETSVPETSEPETSASETSHPKASHSDDVSASEVALPMTFAMRSWHNDPSLPSDPLQLVPKLELGPGPGTELKHVLPWFDDDSKVLQINRWGAEGSLIHIETIIDWILEVAQQRGLSTDQITRPIATAMVQTAVKRFHKKFPDGVPSEEDEQ